MLVKEEKRRTKPIRAVVTSQLKGFSSRIMFWFKSLTLNSNMPCLMSSSQAKEVQIRKQFHEAVKTQQRQYKALKEHILQTTPKAEQKTVVRKLKGEQMRKLAALGDQYEASIAEMLQQQNVSIWEEGGGQGRRGVCIDRHLCDKDEEEHSAWDDCLLWCFSCQLVMLVCGGGGGGGYSWNGKRGEASSGKFLTSFNVMIIWSEGSVGQYKPVHTLREDIFFRQQTDKTQTNQKNGHLKFSVSSSEFWNSFSDHWER